MRTIVDNFFFKMKFTAFNLVLVFILGVVHEAILAWLEIF